ncbi:DNA-directed RNA polymerase subunit delta [Caryophanon tenue]|uniref:DNA-directed RNA polymerase subunit delta n=1 Tax=Caryophanon tenue TaxID=33978 RepID=UPI000AF8752C|nr:DNA-directed RNA polymerase subunit delta [Caryophanon tenue]
MNFRDMTTEQLAEESLINLAYAILEDKKATIKFEDLLKEIQQLNGATDEYMASQLVQFYTDMNVDGRFLLNQESGWGLREWYKVEQIEEETAPTVKTRKKKAKAVVDEEVEEVEIDEDDLVFEEDYEEFVEEDEDEEEDVLDFDNVVDEDLEDIEDEDIEEEIEIEDEFELEEDELDEDELDEDELEEDLK